MRPCALKGCHQVHVGHMGKTGPCMHMEHSYQGHVGPTSDALLMTQTMLHAAVHVKVTWLHMTSMGCHMGTCMGTCKHGCMVHMVDLSSGGTPSVGCMWLGLSMLHVTAWYCLAHEPMQYKGHSRLNPAAVQQQGRPREYTACLRQQ